MRLLASTGPVESSGSKAHQGRIWPVVKSASTRLLWPVVSIRPTTSPAEEREEEDWRRGAPRRRGTGTSGEEGRLGAPRRTTTGSNGQKRQRGATRLVGTPLCGGRQGRGECGMRATGWVGRKTKREGDRGWQKNFLNNLHCSHI